MRLDKERECTIASIQYNARMERENLEKIIAEKDALIAALKAENAHLKAGK